MNKTKDTRYMVTLALMAAIVNNNKEYKQNE